MALPTCGQDVRTVPDTGTAKAANLPRHSIALVTAVCVFAARYQARFTLSGDGHLQPQDATAVVCVVPWVLRLGRIRESRPGQILGEAAASARLAVYPVPVSGAHAGPRRDVADAADAVRRAASLADRRLDVGRADVTS